MPVPGFSSDMVSVSVTNSSQHSPRQKAPTEFTADRGTSIALIFALVAERLSIYYEHEKWMTKAQGATLAADWLSRSKRSMSTEMRRQISDLSDQMARQIAEALSREAGLQTAHEMMESLDPHYQSEIGRSLMVECARLLDSEAEESQQSMN